MTSQARLRAIPSTVPGPDEITALHELRTAIDQAVGSLTSTEALIVRRYYGFEGDECTYDELGQELGVSGGRIHQILAKALRKLRHPARYQLLRPHVVFKEIERAEKEAAEAEEAERAALLAEASRQAEEQRISDELRRRIGNEIGRADSWWSDRRRQDISETLACVTNTIVTEVRSRDEARAYLHKHFDSSTLAGCRIYQAWKRDVWCRLRDNTIAFACGIMTDGSYLIYAQKDRRTWYLFDAPYELSADPIRWIGYVDGDAGPRRRVRELEQSMHLLISIAAEYVS